MRWKDAVDHEVDDNRDHGGEEDQHEGRGSYRQEECHATEEVIQNLWGLREDGGKRRGVHREQRDARAGVETRREQCHEGEAELVAQAEELLAPSSGGGSTMMTPRLSAAVHAAAMVALVATAQKPAGEGSPRGGTRARYSYLNLPLYTGRRDSTGWCFLSPYPAST